MKKIITNLTVGVTTGAVLFAGLTFNGSEAINRVQGRVDRLASTVIRLVGENDNLVGNIEDLERELEYKYDRLETEEGNSASLVAEIKRLEAQLRLANQAAENLDVNTSNQYQNAMSVYQNRRTLEG